MEFVDVPLPQVVEESVVVAQIIPEDTVVPSTGVQVPRSLEEVVERFDVHVFLCIER